MHHARAHEPVMDGRVDVGSGVRTVAQPAAFEIGRDLPGDAEVEGGELLLDRGEVAAEVRVLARTWRTDGSNGVGHDPTMTDR